MKTIKDLKQVINDLPDDMPITMFYNGSVYRNDIFFHIKKLWHDSKLINFFTIDWNPKKKEDFSIEKNDML